MKILIDSREQDRIKSATKYYNQQGIETEIQELLIGDYIFTNGKTDVVFEFKTIPDFISSIQDNRVFNQSINMAENFDHRFVLIHGDESTRAKSLAMTKHHHRVTIYQYIGAISSINRYCTVLQVYSPYIDEAFYTMMAQSKKIFQDKPIVKRFPKKEKCPALNFLAHDIYGINYKRAKLIVDTYDLHSLNDLMTLTIDKLTAIDGIGENTAKKILDAIQ